MRVLLVEDDDLLADAVRRGLTRAGFSVAHCASAEHARIALRAEGFDIGVFDVGLPGADGMSLLQELRSTGNSMPVLVLTARYALSDKIRAFEGGADDFLMKPFEQAELAARCRALVRRAGTAPSGRLQLGGAVIDLSGHRLLVDGQAVELTRREWALLEVLAHNAGRVVTKDKLVGALSGSEEELSPNAVETHMSRLRGKLAEAAVIRTIRGLGYRLDDPRATH